MEGSAGHCPGYDPAPRCCASRWHGSRLRRCSGYWFRDFVRNRARLAVGLTGQVEVLLADDPTLRRLNKSFRGKNKPTDVLSFPTPDEIAGTHAGDLAISLETAARQAATYGHSLHDEVRILLLHGLLNASDGGEDAAIGHLYMLARTFRQMLIISEKNVRDPRAIWQVLWQGFRMPPFAAEDLIKQARRYKSRRELTRAIRLVARADLELRSSPANKLLVLERLILDLSTEPKPTTYDPTLQFAMEL